MRQLSDILLEKKSKTGNSWAEIGRLLGGIDGQLIGKYAKDKAMPSLDFAIKWHLAFNENLVDLIFDYKRVIETPSEIKDELIDTQRALIRCMAEKEQISKEFEELKKFGDATREQKLEPVKKNA